MKSFDAESANSPRAITNKRITFEFVSIFYEGDAREREEGESARDLNVRATLSVASCACVNRECAKGQRDSNARDAETNLSCSIINSRRTFNFIIPLVIIIKPPLNIILWRRMDLAYK